MAFIQLDDQITEHPKILRAGAVASWVWVAAIAYCQRQLTDGFVPDAAVPRLPAETTPKTLAKLVEVGLFDRVDGGYQVHDYLLHNPSRETVTRRRAESAARKERYRATRDGRVPERGTGASQVRVTQTSSRARVPTPTPTPTPDTDTDVSVCADAPTHTPTPAAADVVPDWGGSPARRLSPGNAWHATRKGLSVPQFLHDELLSRMGTPDEPALLRWYVDTEQAYHGRSIGETALQFWRARFAEWQGTTGREARVSTLQPLSDFIPSKFRTGGAA